MYHNPAHQITNHWFWQLSTASASCTSNYYSSLGVHMLFMLCVLVVFAALHPANSQQPVSMSPGNLNNNQESEGNDTVHC